MPHKINHIAIVVEDLNAALTFWRDALGLPLEHTESNMAEEVEIGFLQVGEAHIELLEPTNPESGIGKFLAKRGAGFHHLCVEVEDIRASMEHLRHQGVRLIHDDPKTREGGTRYCFIHPSSADGVLVELYELPKA